MALLEIQYPIIIQPLFEVYGQDNFNFQTRICNLRFFFFFFFIGIHSMQGSRRHGVKRKRSRKRVKHTGNLFRKNLQLKRCVNSRLKATKIMGQRKAFYWQRIPESSCARKETVDLDILVTSRNGERKIMHSIRIMSRSPLKIQGFTVHLCSVILPQQIS